MEEEPPWEFGEEQDLWKSVRTPGVNYRTQTQGQHKVWLTVPAAKRTTVSGSISLSSVVMTHRFPHRLLINLEKTERCTLWLLHAFSREKENKWSGFTSKMEMMYAKLRKYTHFCGIDPKDWEKGQSLQTINEHVCFRHSKTGTSRTIGLHSATYYSALLNSWLCGRVSSYSKH